MKELASIVTLALLLCPGCTGNVDRANQNQNDDAQASNRERQAYQTKIENRLKDLDQEISDLEGKLGNSRVDREEIKQRMADLEHKREVAHERLEKLKSSSQQAWSDMRAGIDAAMADLERAYQNAAAHFE